MPRLRHRNPMASSRIQARSPWVWATAIPTTSSPTSATTAGSPDRAAAITSATLNTGSADPGPRLWSHTPIA